MKAYFARFDGDISHLEPVAGKSLEECLSNVRSKHRFGQKVKDKYFPDEETVFTPDPEDDKIEVWEIDTDTASAKVVWGFWGWHWPVPDGLEQGILPGDNKSLYEISSEE